MGENNLRLEGVNQDQPHEAPEFTRIRSNYIFPRQTIITLLEDAMESARIPGKYIGEIIDSIPENIYQGGGRLQLSDWLKDLHKRLASMNLGPATADDITTKFQRKLKELKESKK